MIGLPIDIIKIDFSPFDRHRSLAVVRVAVGIKFIICVEFVDAAPGDGVVEGVGVEGEGQIFAVVG